LAEEIECHPRTLYRDLEAEVAGTDEIRFWVMNWGSHAEVLEPKSLRSEIRAEAEAMAHRDEKGAISKESPRYGLSP